MNIFCRFELIKQLWNILGFWKGQKFALILSLLRDIFEGCKSERHTPVAKQREPLEDPDRRSLLILQREPFSSPLVSLAHFSLPSSEELLSRLLNRYLQQKRGDLLAN